MQDSSLPGRGLQPVLSWKRHGRVGVWAAVLLLLLGAPLIFLKSTSFFVAEAVFQVEPSYQKNLSVDKDLELQSNSQYREFVNHLSRSVLRYDVLERALATLARAGVNPRLPAETERKCIERLQRTIYVYAVADTYMVRVGLQSPEREHLDEIVNAVMDAFIETTRNEQIFGSDQRGKVLAERSQVLRGEISAYEQQRIALAARLGLTTFGENTSNPFDAMLAQAREKLTLAQIERSQAQATLDSFVKQNETPVSAGRSVLEMRLQDNGLQALRNEVVKRSEELSRQMSGLESLHPARQPAVDEQKEIGQRLASREAAFEGAARLNVRARLVASVLQTSQVEKGLLEHVRTIEGQTADFAGNFRVAMRLTADIRKREQELDDIRNRQNYVGTERNAIGFVRLIMRALPADTPQGVGKTRLLLVLLAAAAALALALPLVVNMLDRRILTVGDAERALNIASAAWLVGIHNESTRILARDQFRRFASTLLRNHARGSSGVFGFSSVSLGGGATAVVLELARTLQQLGTRVLVVDADSLSHHSPLGSQQIGLTDLLAGQAPPDAVISRQEHLGVGIDVVPFGLSRDSGVQRLDLLREAVAHWTTAYDIVLVDVPPILPSADAELLIDAIGQIFLVVEADVTTKGEVARVRGQLEKLAPQAVGLVVNKVALEVTGGELRAQLVETITREPFHAFMSMPAARLQWQMLLLRWQQWRLWPRR